MRDFSGQEQTKDTEQEQQAAGHAEVDSVIERYPDAATLGPVLATHPRRDAIIERLHQTKGNAFVQSALNAGPQTEPKEAALIARIQTMLSDQYMDRTEWATILPLLAPYRGRPSKVAEFLVAELAYSERPTRSMFAMRDEVSEFLVSGGYRIPRDSYQETDVAKLIESNKNLPEPKPQQLDAAIATLRTAQPVTAEVFHATLRPVMWRLQHTISDQTRALLRLYCDHSVQFAPDVEREFARMLRDYGFNVEVGAPRPEANQAAELEQGHIRSSDTVFDELSKATGENENENKVKVGVIDGGFDPDHIATQTTVATNQSEVAGNNKDDDHNGYVDDAKGHHFLKPGGGLDPGSGYGVDMAGHGTAVMGIATKGTDRVEAVLVGVNPSEIGKCIDYAVARGAKVVNLSLHLDETEVDQFREAIARHPNVLFVMAAGNDNASLEELPPHRMKQTAPAPNLLVVGSQTASGDRWQASGYGSNTSKTNVDLAATGSTFSTAPRDEYREGGATSQATPVVSNAAAKCMALDPGLSATKVHDLIRMTVAQSDVWKDQTSTGGALDATAAMKLAAITGTMRKGKSFAEAAQMIGLPTELHAQYEAWARQLLDQN